MAFHDFTWYFMIQLFWTELLMATSNFKGRHREKLIFYWIRAQKSMRFALLFWKLCYHSTYLWAKTYTQSWIANVHESFWVILSGVYALASLLYPVGWQKSGQWSNCYNYSFSLISALSLCCLVLQFASQHPFTPSLVITLGPWATGIIISHEVTGDSWEKGGRWREEHQMKY